MRYAVERHRLLAAQTEDAGVWAALARTGEALLGATGRGLLERLCDVAAEELGCDAARLWVLDQDGGSWLAAAAKPAREWSRVEGLRLPSNALAPLALAGGDDAAVRWLTPALRRALPPELFPSRASDDTLLLGLAPGGDLLGVVACTYRERPAATSVTNRVARGLLHLGALALSNARLVDDLERSNTIKTYFAATMSHELRNTLFAIAGLSDILRKGLAEGEHADMGRLARTIGERSRESQAMIQAALELTRSEVRPIDRASGEVAVGDLLQQLASEVHVPAGKPALRVEWDVPNRLPPLRTDAVKLSMILRNLIGNAIKFTERGHVRVTVEAVEETMRIVVADSGIGIDAADLPHLFEPFRQVHGQRSKRAGGAGLGLYIVGRLVELLGGTIGVESRAGGGGTTFTVSLPVPPPADA
jgi:signal transduction histidine kinase